MVNLIIVEAVPNIILIILIRYKQFDFIKDFVTFFTQRNTLDKTCVSSLILFQATANLSIKTFNTLDFNSIN